METQVRTPQLVFMQPQRLVVPLFQRPYVWNRENQWEPLWADIIRVADRYLTKPHEKQFPHFLGAVVLQQVQLPTGSLQGRTIIDGQQRLTTLQLLLDALHAELVVAGARQPAARLEPLVANAEAFRANPEDRFKVWPTNRDRKAFRAVMEAEPPVDYDALGRGDRMVEAHRFFSEQAREWLGLDGLDRVADRSAALDTVVRDLLQMVVIDLAADENAQEIFETLNARGAQLTAADLVKNLIFQRLLESGADVEAAYEQHWKDFETGFWEAEVSVGRTRYPRSAVFLNHWLVARTGEEILAREVFFRFKSFIDVELDIPIAASVAQLHRAAGVYRSFVKGAAATSGPIDRLGLFGYRTGVLESEVIKPLVVWLLDPEQPAVPKAQLTKALDVVESWMVRRMLVRATTKSYTQVIAELITHLHGASRSEVGDVIEEFFRGQTSGSRYWPDDEEVRTELEDLQAYRRLRRGRLRMVLEAIEDHLRGWVGGKEGLGGERVPRDSYAIEHIMPRKWAAHWPLGKDGGTEEDRDRLVHTFGNLSLLTAKLNSKVSNGPWLGGGGKHEGLQTHDVLFLNREILNASKQGWTDELIRTRTARLIEAILEIWPVPEGHRSGFSGKKVRTKRKIDLADLIGAGALAPGSEIVPRRKKHADRRGTLLSDGRIDVEGAVFDSPSGAAKHLTGKPTNGWSFWLVDAAARRSLRNVLSDYVETIASDGEDDVSLDEDDGDDE